MTLDKCCGLHHSGRRQPIDSLRRRRRRQAIDQAGEQGPLHFLEAGLSSHVHPCMSIIIFCLTIAPRVFQEMTIIASVEGTERTTLGP